MAADNLAATSTDAHLLAYVDNDLEKSYEFRCRWKGRLKFMTGHRIGLARSLNSLANCYRDDYDIFGHTTDDSVITTDNWEHHVRVAFRRLPGGIGVVFPSHDDPQFPGYPMISRRMLDALGWFACPGTDHWGWDMVLRWLGSRTESVMLRDDQFHISHRSGSDVVSSTLGYDDDLNAGAYWIGSEGDACVKMLLALRGAA